MEPRKGNSDRGSPDNPKPTDELVDFRINLRDCFTKWGDALFELGDAALCSQSPVGSVPSLSLEPVFRRSHGSLYKSLARGRIDADELRELLVANRPTHWPLVFAVDASTWARCDAETSPERGFHYSASKHSNGQPIVAGWSYQWITQLDWAPDSWTAPLDVARIPPSADATNTTIDQVRRLVGLLPADAHVPMFVFDAGYDAIALGAELADQRVQVLARIRSDRVFYAEPDFKPAGFATGRPRRHGARFALPQPDTWTTPDAELHAHDQRYGDIHVQAWHDLHPKLGTRGHWSEHERPPIVRGTLIRVHVQHLPKHTEGRVKKTLWLWWSGPEQPDLDVCWRAYLRRFDIEHTFRFIKGTLGWTTPALRTPEQADRWTWLVAVSYTQLRLARGVVDDIRLPWEKRRDPAKLTPVRVRRGFPRLCAIIGTPASAPKSKTAGPGRPKGTTRPPRTRYPAVKKAA